MTREEKVIRSFEKVRQSGITNMFARDVVCDLAGITKDEYMHVIKNYDDLIKKYNVSRKG